MSELELAQAEIARLSAGLRCIEQLRADDCIRAMDMARRVLLGLPAEPDAMPAEAED